MSISLSSFTLEEKARALKSLIQTVESFLSFAAQNHEDLTIFFTNLNEHHLRLTRDAAHAKRIVESRTQEDMITRTLGLFTDAVLYYLNFVTMPETEEFMQWVADMNEKVMRLEEACNEAKQVLA